METMYLLLCTSSHTFLSAMHGVNTLDVENKVSKEPFPAGA